jgi:L-iditol 2-dehydrogenase
VIAAAPSAKAQEQAITLATIRGRVSFFGGLPMTAPCAFVNSNLIHYRELSISGAYGSMPRITGRRSICWPPAAVMVRFSSG